MMGKTVSLIVPTYNERENIKLLIPQIFASCKKIGAKIEVVIVDDNSPDGTAKAARTFGKKYNVRVIVRNKKIDLASAVKTGFSEAKGDILGVMDADMSHPPEVLPLLIRPILENKADLTIGSRHAKGGGVEVWPLSRKLMSKAATLLAYPLTGIKDPMSGLFFTRRRVIEGVKLETRGYKILLEIIVKGRYSKAIEVPYTFRNRTVGKSKIGLSEYSNYLGGLLRLYFYRLKKKRI
ncbi:MAG: polyprenol monophosphomannose synthase [Candidatus Woesearchaeota archaeon]